MQLESPALEYTGPLIMNKDQVDGRLRKAKGKLKEMVGDLAGDKSTKYKGKVEKYAGGAQARYGDIKRKAEKDTD